jgi:hypothetical protein
VKTLVQVNVGDRIRDDEGKLGTVLEIAPNGDVKLKRVGGRVATIDAGEVKENLGPDTGTDTTPEPTPAPAPKAGKGAKAKARKHAIDDNATAGGDFAMLATAPKAKAGKGAKRRTPKEGSVEPVPPVAAPEPVATPATPAEPEEVPTPAPAPEPVLTPITGGTLQDRAMLVDLSIGFWEGRRKDAETSQEVIAKEGAEKDAGAWWTYTIPKGAIRDVLVARGHAREVHLKYTLPWLDNGQRVLPTAAYITYTQAMRERRAEFEAAVEKFLAKYPDHVADAKQRLGGLADGVKFPTVAELRAKFPWRLFYTPLPSGTDFRVALNEDEVAALRAQVEGNVGVAMQATMQDLYTRLHGVVAKMAERLGDAEGVFRDSLVTNLKAVCGLLPALNVDNDPNLEALRAEVEAKLATADPGVLRANKGTRADTAKAAKAILAKMETYMAKK